MRAGTAPPVVAYELADVEARAAEHPSFQIPTVLERAALKVGDLVKLVFSHRPGNDQPAAERMWVEIIALEHRINAPPVYHGTLENDPQFIPAKYGDRVRFESKHVCAIEKA